MSLPKYSEYKKTNVEWLTEVPAHWNIQSCRGVLTDRNERNEPLINENYLSLMANIGIILYEEKGDVGNKKPEDLGKCKQVYPGDLVINSMNYGIGSYGLSKHRGVCSPVYIVLTPKLNKVEERYAFRILEIKKFQQYAQSFGNGILEHRASISWDILKNIGLPLPSIEEQRNILQFLDIEIAKIDNLVKDQEKLIELLKEKRQSVVSNVVTKGLDPKVKMKNSGVKWLGLVPEHWSLRKLKYISEFAGGGTPSRDNVEFWNGEIPWVSPKDMKVEFLENAEEKITQHGLMNSSSNLIEAGQVLMVVRSGILKHTIPVAINVIPVSMNQDMKALKFNDSTCKGEFFVRWVQGLNDLLLLEWAKQGATVESIEHNYLKETVIPLPPLEEQLQITEYLKKLISEFDGLMKSSEDSINLLQERRSALISAAVTGQIDVRNYQPKEIA